MSAELAIGEDSGKTLDAEKSRSSIIVRTSVIGIVANVLLASFKAVIGIVSNSIAIVMDAVNNISDAASSIITIVGTKLAGKEPDKKHPFGYGRIEYLSAMIISVLVLYAGVTAFTESVKKIINPEKPDYSTVSLIIVGVAVVVKIVLGRYVKRVGEKVNSDALVNSGEDARLDSVISTSTLAAALIYIASGISLEAWLGTIIAAVIIKAGFDMLRDTVSKILGEKVDADLAREIKKTLMSYPDVSGAYDLVMHNYGPESFVGSVHIEVPDTLSADDLDKLLRKIALDVYHKHNVLLTAIGVYSVNTKNPEAIQAREKVRELVMADKNIIQMHGFYFDKAEKNIRFDIVVSFDALERSKVYKEAHDKVQKAFPDYALQMIMDTDFTEE